MKCLNLNPMRIKLICFIVFVMSMMSCSPIASVTEYKDGFGSTDEVRVCYKKEKVAIRNAKKYILVRDSNCVNMSIHHYKYLYK